VSDSYNSKRITGKEKLAQYRKALYENKRWAGILWEKRGYSNTAEPWLNDRYS